MKKTLLTSLLILFGFVLSYGQTAPSGTGTESDPYQITTLDNLIWMAKTDSVWDDGAFFSQTADIDASATDTMNIGGFDPGWSGIGSGVTSFTGSYDGAGFVIDGLAVNNNKPNAGLFGSVRGFAVKDLGLTNIDMSVGGSSGALIGYADTSLTVNNCYATGEMVGNSNWTGGLIGFIRNCNFTITNSYSEVNVLNDGDGSDKFAAGFLGYIELTGDNGYAGTIEGCYATGDVSLTTTGRSSYVGGFIARVTGSENHTKWSSISKCYATGNVVGAAVSDYAPAGGFIGNVNWRYRISECYSTGNVVSSGKDAGGFIGYFKYEGYVENCYSTGNVVRSAGSTQPNFGGFIGSQNAWGATPVYFSEVKSCYSTGSVSGVDVNGYGFFGHQASACKDTLNYYDVETSLQDSTIGNAMGKTTAEMKTESTFADWDFASTWEIDGNYPNLVNNSNSNLVPVPVFAGSGTESDPYQIGTLDDLVALVQHQEFWSDSSYFVQTANIDASATDTMVIAGFNAGWSPIGNVITSFKGVYDGGGFTIDGLTSHGNTANMGLFGTVDGGITVKDLGLTNVAMTTGGSSGALLGYATGVVELENCYSTGTLEGQGTKVGGLVGTIEPGSNSSITDCYSEVSVANLGAADYTMTGGFIGQLNGTGTVSKCHSTGDVVGSPDADAKLFTGGFVGLFDAAGALITKSYSTGNVTGSLIRNGFSPAGGFAGTAYHGATISECYATGNVTNSGDNTGGFIGYTKYNDVLVSNCYSLGNVTRTAVSSQTKYGSFCGRNRQGSLIENSYSTGSVTFEGVDNPTGNGFIGDVTGATDTLCFFDKETSLQDSTVGSAIAKTTAEMKTESTFTDSSWDFASTWMMDGNYPNLVNNSNPDLLPQPLFAGSGTEADPYKITVLADLQTLTQHPEVWGEYFIQTADIDAAATATWDDTDDDADGDKYNDANDLTADGTNEGWLPIGVDETSMFSGSYDGAGFVINNLTANRPSQDFKVAFFGFVRRNDSGMRDIKNVSLINVDITGKDWVAGLIGHLKYKVNVTNCSVTGTINGGIRLGGLIGYCTSTDNVVSECHTNVTINGLSSVGGLIGRKEKSGLITKSSSISVINAEGSNIGGFIGKYYDGQITESYASSTLNITGDSKDIGGFVGINRSSISDSYSLSTYQATSAAKGYGFCGKNDGGSIANSYAAGKVVGGGGFDPYNRGFIGINSGTFSNNFVDTTATGQSSGLGATARSTEEMKMESTFTDSSWDFTSIWKLENSYPDLINNPNTVPVIPVELIADVRVDADSNGIPDRLDEVVTVQGVVTTLSFSSSFLVGLQDSSAGIVIYQKGNDSTDLALGTKLEVVGTVGQYNGLTEIYISDFTVLGTEEVPAPIVVTTSEYLANGEALEGMLVKIENVSKTGTSTWPASGSNGAYYVTDGVDTVKLWLDKDTHISDSAEVASPMNVTALAAQYSSSNSYTSGHQLWPRFYTDLETLVSVNNEDGIPVRYALQQNYPNPFNPTTVISFALPKASDVQLSVYNILGEKVTELVNSKMVAGNHTINFNAANLASGMYIYRIKAGSFVSVKKMMLLK